MNALSLCLDSACSDFDLTLKLNPVCVCRKQRVHQGGGESKTPEDAARVLPAGSRAWWVAMTTADGAFHIITSFIPMHHSAATRGQPEPWMENLEWKKVQMLTETFPPAFRNSSSEWMDTKNKTFKSVKAT